jgi:hypothetical protein
MARQVKEYFENFKKKAEASFLLAAQANSSRASCTFRF